MKYHQDIVDAVLADFLFVANLRFPDFVLLQMIDFQFLLLTLVDCTEKNRFKVIRILYSGLLIKFAKKCALALSSDKTKVIPSFEIH